jgi:hypothetical protein
MGETRSRLWRRQKIRANVAWPSTFPSVGEAGQKMRVFGIDRGN